MKVHRKLVVGIVLSCGWLAGAGAAQFEDTPPPTIRSFAGTFFGTKLHDYYVETEIVLPLARYNGLGLDYRYRETTPFLDLIGPQAEVLYTRFELEGSLKLTPQVRLIAVGGYHSSQTEDRHGFVAGQVVGLGLGSVAGSAADWIDWRAVAGVFPSRQGLSADWWTDLNASWRVWQWRPQPYGESTFQPALVLNATVSSANDGDRFSGEYRVGPALRLLSANYNYLDISFSWYHTDGHPFFGLDDDGLLAGFNVSSGPEQTAPHDVRSQRASGWMPLLWGAYDAGVGSQKRIARFEMNVEILDHEIAGQRITEFVSYESRQEYRPGDYDNIAYTVSLGARTEIGLASPLSHGDTLVTGLDFFHRSDHSLDPTGERVSSEGEPIDIDGVTTKQLPHASLNGARAVLQTRGWDLPYRDPTMYERRTDWLNIIDWRLTSGLSIGSSRKRGLYLGQLGVNWDIATIDGYVVYARGIGSIGNETPDWLGELGVRRPAGYLFTRYESYHMRPNLARGDTVVVGLGVNL